MPEEEKYSLQRVLEMRERERDETALYLTECRRLLEIAELELTQRVKAVEKCRQAQAVAQNEMIEKSHSGIKSADLVRHRQHLADLREAETKLRVAVEKQKQVVARAAQTADKALEAVYEKTKEVNVIDKHRENWLTKKKTERERREQKSNDETGAILYQRDKFE